MTQYKATANGLVPFTPEEQAEWEAQQAEWEAKEPERNKAANKSQAEQLLKDTDWVEIPSVSNAMNNPHLTNYDDFIAYRLAVRAIAVSPPTTPAAFPAKPDENWSQ